MAYLDVKSSGTSLNIHVYETVTSSVINILLHTAAGFG